MATNQKEGSRIPNPASDPLRRVSRRTASQSKAMKSLSVTTKVDRESFTFSFELAVTLLLRSRSCSPGVVGCFKQLLNNVLEQQDLLGYIDSCSAVRQVLVTCGWWNKDLFKGLKGRWVRSIVIAIETAIQSDLCVHPSSTFDAVVTFLGWLKRLPVAIRPTSDSVAAYYECDDRISSFDFDGSVYAAQLADIWQEWFGSFHLTSPFIPRHGPGSTADCGRVRSRKWSKLGIDAVGRVCLRSAALEVLVHEEIKDTLHAGRLSKVLFVPKQAGKDRTICMEPAWLQYYQHGVADQLSRFTHSGGHQLSKLVNVYSQEQNRRLCAQAYQLKLATIDLSDASDSVSWRLVKRLCHGLPLLRYLHGTRSTHTLIDGRIEQFDKFAPMGSALCFPIECYVFASIVELAYRKHYGKASQGHLSGCSVYGDDIICPSEIYHLVVDILVSLGFVVNTSKSYSSGAYYESCGVEYLYGALITTVKHPRRHLHPGRMASPEDVGMITDVANSLLTHGYTKARRMLLKSYSELHVRVGRREVPFSDLVIWDDKHCLSVLDSYKSTVWNKKLQRSGSWFWSLEAATASAWSDFQQWKSQNVPRTREMRISDLRRPLRKVTVDPKWSPKAITCLARFHHWDMLETGDLVESGTCRTGRSQYILVRRFSKPS